MDIHEMNDTKAAFKESTIDTLIGTIINLPLNIALLWVANMMNLSIWLTGVALSVVFFVIAIVRKTIVRLYFNQVNLTK